MRGFHEENEEDGEEATKHESPGLHCLAVCFCLVPLLLGCLATFCLFGMDAVLIFEILIIGSLTTNYKNEKDDELEIIPNTDKVHVMYTVHEESSSFLVQRMTSCRSRFGRTKIGRGALHL